MDRDKLKKSLVKHEGVKHKVYKDSLGIPTIGVGHRVAASQLPNLRLSDRQIDKLLDIDISIATGVVHEIFGKEFYEQSSDNIQRFMVEMAFNLGYRLNSFRKANKALKQGNYTKAKAEYINSLWASQVGPNRVNDMINLLY